MKKKIIGLCLILIIVVICVFVLYKQSEKRKTTTKDFVSYKQSEKKKIITKDFVTIINYDVFYIHTKQIGDDIEGKIQVYPSHTIYNNFGERNSFLQKSKSWSLTGKKSSEKKYTIVMEDDNHTKYDAVINMDENMVLEAETTVSNQTLRYTYKKRKETEIITFHQIPKNEITKIKSKFEIQKQNSEYKKMESKEMETAKQKIDELQKERSDFIVAFQKKMANRENKKNVFNFTEEYFKKIKEKKLKENKEIQVIFKNFQFQSTQLLNIIHDKKDYREIILSKEFENYQMYKIQFKIKKENEYMKRLETIYEEAFHIYLINIYRELQKELNPKSTEMLSIEEKMKTYVKNMYEKEEYELYSEMSKIDENINKELEKIK